MLSVRGSPSRTKRLRSLSLFFVLHTVSNSSSYGNIKAIVNLDLLGTMPAALIRSVNNDLLDKLVHDLGCQFRDMLILLNRLNESGHIRGLIEAMTKAIRAVPRGCGKNKAAKSRKESALPESLFCDSAHRAGKYAGGPALHGSDQLKTSKIYLT